MAVFSSADRPRSALLRPADGAGAGQFAALLHELRISLQAQTRRKFAIDNPIGIQHTPIDSRCYR
ncbi:hypothetical protein SBA4_230005 [Candidatus Sulfopaludibacter sp. SbA4]|nr:hypothetical protein SBA4_230005 [Candidatus Sulfopaludibacter sp. SbA4]